MESLSGARRKRPRRRGVWRYRRPAGAAPAQFLLRHHDAGLCHHRHPGRTGMEERDRRRHRHAGAGVSLAVRSGLGFLLFLLRPCRACHLDDGQHRRQPVWPGPHRHPRRRSRRRSLGHRQAAMADHRLPVRRRPGGHRRRAVLFAAILHHARRLHFRPVDPVLHRHPDRRPRVDPRPAARHHHPDRAA